MSKENPFNTVVPIGAARDIRIEKAKKEGNFEAIDQEEVAKFLDQLVQSSKYDIALVTKAMQKVSELEDTMKMFLDWSELEKVEEYKEMHRRLILGLEQYEKKYEKG